jgi:hypothetical protein
MLSLERSHDRENPSFAEAHCNLAALYEARGEKGLAIQHYAAAKRLLQGKPPQSKPPLASFEMPLSKSVCRDLNGPYGRAARRLR